MVKLYDEGIYLVNGTEIVPESEAAKVQALTGKAANKEEAKKGTMACSILSAHNTSGDMEHLKLKFDAMASHDITFVGIVQTAKASGMEKFPLPYVLTNCHNSLCAVGGTINEDDHMFGLSAKVGVAGGDILVGGRYLFGHDEALTGDDKVRAWNLGAAYIYPLSKRTALKAYAGYADSSKGWKDKEEVAYNGYQLYLGMRHSF